MKSREFKRGPVTIWGELLNFDKISIMVDYLAMAILTKSKYRELIMLHNFIILQSTSHLHLINFQNTTGKRKIICFITVSRSPLFIATKKHKLTSTYIHIYFTSNNIIINLGYFDSFWDFMSYHKIWHSSPWDIHITITIFQCNMEFRKVYFMWLFYFSELSSCIKYPLYIWIWVMSHPTSLFPSKWRIFL